VPDGCPFRAAIRERGKGLAAQRKPRSRPGTVAPLGRCRSRPGALLAPITGSGKSLLEGTRGAELHPGLDFDPATDEFLVGRRYSAFYATEYEVFEADTLLIARRPAGLPAADAAALETSGLTAPAMIGTAEVKPDLGGHAQTSFSTRRMLPPSTAAISVSESPSRTSSPQMLAKFSVGFSNPST
jgi:hypothetical protein